MTLILINKLCTFMKTFLYKYSTAWIKVVILILEKGFFFLFSRLIYTHRGLARKLSCWIFGLTFFKMVELRMCVCFFEFIQHIYLEFFELIRVSCIYFFPSFWGSVDDSLNLDEDTLHRSNQSWPSVRSLPALCVFFFFFFFITSSGCLKSGAFFFLV